MSNFPNLLGAMNLRATDPMSRLCFHRAVALTMDRPTMHLVVGKMPGVEAQDWIPGASRTPWYHAWCEGDGKLFSPSLFEEHGYVLYGMDPRLWYAENIPLETRTLSWMQVLSLANSHGWHRYFQHGQPIKIALPQVILSEVGFPFLRDPTGGILAL